MFISKDSKLKPSPKENSQLKDFETIGVDENDLKYTRIFLKYRSHKIFILIY